MASLQSVLNMNEHARRLTLFGSCPSPGRKHLQLSNTDHLDPSPTKWHPHGCGTSVKHSQSSGEDRHMNEQLEQHVLSIPIEINPEGYESMGVGVSS